MDGKREYRICAMQNSYITFVNGVWQGTIGPEEVDANAALQSCPLAWEYLNRAGAEGWRLVSALTTPSGELQVQTLFLERSTPAS